MYKGRRKRSIYDRKTVIERWLDSVEVRERIRGKKKEKKREWNIAEQNKRDGERKNFVKSLFSPSNVIWQEEREAQK